jgi:hypothetical protein
MSVYTLCKWFESLNVTSSSVVKEQCDINVNIAVVLEIICFAQKMQCILNRFSYHKWCFFQANSEDMKVPVLCDLLYSSLRTSVWWVNTNSAVCPIVSQYIDYILFSKVFFFLVEQETIFITHLADIFYRSMFLLMEVPCPFYVTVFDN